MECPQCGLSNRPNATACAKCHTPLPAGQSNAILPSNRPFPVQDENQTVVDEVRSGGGLGSAAAVKKAAIEREVVEVGSVLGDRYEIFRQTLPVPELFGK